MKILHTADLHLGQIIYQHYSREDEHLYFLNRLQEIIDRHKPDLLIVAGDIFDIPQPSASCWKLFTSSFVEIRKENPDMHICIVAGNHDSASRLQSHSEIWALADTTIIGTPPPLNTKENPGWEEDFILRLPTGYVITLPYMSNERTDAAVTLQEYVAKENKHNLPVVMTGHLAVTGADFTSHDTEIGMLRTTDITRFGTGYDYFALGHIHRPQTINQSFFPDSETQTYTAPVARYSGSAIHVSCDETFPHSVSFIEIATHKGEVKVTALPLKQLRHFYTFPKESEPFSNQNDILKFLDSFIKRNEESCYIRFRVADGTDLSSDFNSRVYEMIESSGKDIRYNPKILWTGVNKEETDKTELNAEIEVEELQQMTDPLQFIRLTADKYPDFDIDSLSDAFSEIEKELKLMNEEENGKRNRK